MSFLNIFIIQGRAGRDGIPGKDGKEFSSLELLRDVINETVVKGQ